MSSRFIALPAGRGEAFLLKTEHKGKDVTILVDSGSRYSGKPHPLVKLIEEAVPDLKCIDIAICTHQDRDHAAGFRTFADAWCATGRKIGAFWLPGRWSAVIRQILLKPDELIQRIRNGAVQISERILSSREKEGRMGLEEHLRILAKDLEFNFTDSQEDSEDEEFEQLPTESEISRRKRLARSLGMNTDELHSLESSLKESNYSPARIFQDLEKGLLCSFLSLQAFETAKIIALIAEQAVHWQIPIRWFDFDLFEKTEKAYGGIKNFLEPVNSVELRQPPPELRQLSPEVFNKQIFFCLMLTKQNVESLVFNRVEQDNEPGVMFLGDSRLAFGINKPDKDFPMPSQVPKRPLIVTAPHHGSRVNDRAYEVVRNWLSTSDDAFPIFVRNGGHHKQKIFAFLKECERCCAQCWFCGGSKRLVRTIKISATNGNWEWPSSSVPNCTIFGPTQLTWQV